MASIIELLIDPLQQEETLEKDLVNRIASEIAKIITEYKEVDFEERDDLALELQAKLRLVLRRLNYPVAHREVVIDNIFDVMKKGNF